MSSAIIKTFTEKD